MIYMYIIYRAVGETTIAERGMEVTGEQNENTNTDTLWYSGDPTGYSGNVRLCGTDKCIYREADGACRNDRQCGLDC